jgi:hypothetical protein
MRDLIDRSYEIAARQAGKKRGIRFRRYERWGEWPIKAYDQGQDKENAPDFKTWKEAYNWVKGI